MAKSASGDKSAAWLPGVYGQTQHGQALQARTRGPLSRVLLAEAVRQVEKVVGARRQESPLGG